MDKVDQVAEERKRRPLWKWPNWLGWQDRKKLCRAVDSFCVHTACYAAAIFPAATARSQRLRINFENGPTISQ